MCECYKRSSRGTREKERGRRGGAGGDPNPGGIASNNDETIVR